MRSKCRHEDAVILFSAQNILKPLVDFDFGECKPLIFNVGRVGHEKKYVRGIELFVFCFFAFSYDTVNLIKLIVAGGNDPSERRLDDHTHRIRDGVGNAPEFHFAISKGS